MQPVHRVTSSAIIAPYVLTVRFNDYTEQKIDFSPMLSGELYGSLRDVSLFNQVCIDPEVHTLIWPNSADFDPATLHDWAERVRRLKEMPPQ